MKMPCAAQVELAQYECDFPIHMSLATCLIFVAQFSTKVKSLRLSFATGNFPRCLGRDFAEIYLAVQIGTESAKPITQPVATVGPDAWQHQPRRASLIGHHRSNGVQRRNSLAWRYQGE
ncbi:hypothetical protein HGP17_09895 [Rhizobium sp. P38BS-XIX]|uniref:hypothetical protein n=1 Tax=Rhizobium sp. P38BS-XIX TaxID=2726740 RepID=UPI001457401D|nr:hypothetical protein [Rhizobium sp. P38BS-XIX]NLR97146.1 hypothetical protein [Rhizobium sp. P38BS-XIX]